jgi:hypothetical protein
VETLKRPKISQASLKHYSTAEVREEEQVLSPLSSLFKVLCLTTVPCSSLVKVLGSSTCPAVWFRRKVAPHVQQSGQTAR